jgi:RNA polymerase sigma factor (sigma-70 family)
MRGSRFRLARAFFCTSQAMPEATAPATLSPDLLVEHLFRHEAGRMTAVLAKVLGRGRLEVAQDLVQETLVAALNAWRTQPIPTDPTAWLYTVARRRALDWLRQQQTRKTDATDFTETEVPHEDPHNDVVQRAVRRVEEGYLAEAFTDHAIADSQLRMMFACCHPQFPAITQVGLMLKILCGFTAGEIARAFLVEEEAMSKRLQRARSELSALAPYLDAQDAQHIRQSQPAVAEAIYLLFNEGYSASSGERQIRHDLCREAIRLALLLAQHPLTASPDADALVAQLCLQAARFEARASSEGDIILLPDQDRTRWDHRLIAQGVSYLQRGMAAAPLPTERLLQASIAASHALAPSYAATDWRTLLGLYDALLALAPSAIVQLHRSVVLAEAEGPADALASLDALASPLASYHLYHSIRADVLHRLGQNQLARTALSTALSLARTEPERRLIARKLQGLSG